MTYKLVNHVDRIRCRFIYRGSYNDCLEKFSNICTDLVVKNLNLYQEEDFYFKDEVECKCNECLGINPVISYREINYELNKSIELENETLETFSNGISRKKRKLNIFELNSELESYFDPREKRIEDNLKKFQKWARFM
jgi:hypothetical protein